MIKRSFTVFVLVPVLLAGLLALTGPQPASALTAAQCVDKYNGLTLDPTDSDYKNFKKTNCLKDRFCKTAFNVNSVEITCKKTPYPKPKPKNNDEDSSSISASAGGLSTTCSKANDICLRDLPRPGNTGAGLVQNIIQIAIGIIAALSVLFVAIGGLRYIMSQGDPQGVSKAKSTIVYALVGLAVALLAQGIVILVVNAVT